KKVNTKLVDYAALNQLSKDFKTRFVPQAELSAEQAFWSRYSVQPKEPNLSSSTTIVEVPKELLKEKVLVIAALKETLSKLKGKAVVNEVVSLHSIDSELLKIDVASLAPKLRNNRTAHTNYLRHTQEEIDTLREIVKSERFLNPLNTSLDYAYVASLAPKLRNNRTAHTNYLRHTQEEIDTLREIVKSERFLNPLNTSLDYACKYTKRIQELLVILQQTCPCINDLGTKLMAVTPKNNDKKIRLTKHIPSLGNTPVKTTSSTNVVSNTPVLSSTGVNLLSSASGSQHQGNTKNDRIQRTPSKAKKN
nr:hypothetical protein [Tanacetum cinerariifolium]